MPETITPINIDDEMKSSYLDYAMSVIIGRALPDVRDGLKPVHRRVLFAMHETGNVSNKPYKKSARIVGDVMGKYHPHGDQAIYDTIVRMAQEFSLRHPLVDGQGNFGSIDGDSAAAMRYTEIRMEEITSELLRDLDKDTVQFTPNYDDSLQEPSVLPASFPQLLVNGSSGIAVGMATNIPPHNLNEVIDSAVHVIDNPDCTIEDLMELVLGPDFPTRGIIQGRSGIRAAYKTGRGIIRIRGRAEIETMEKGDRERIIINELPFQVNKARLVEKIAEKHGRPLKELIGDVPFLKKVNAADFTDDTFGLPTVTDILSELEKPGRDPRPEFKAAVFKEGVETLKDLKPSMILEGTVTNVTNFGAFVDIGVHQDGLVHVSALADKFVEDPHDVVKPGDIVKVKVLEVDLDRKRISLTMRMDDQPAEKAAGQRPASARKGNGGGQRQGGNKRGGGQPQNTGGGTFADLFAKAKDEQKKGKKRL